MTGDRITGDLAHWSCEAEQSVLGCLLLNPDALHVATGMRLEAGQFFHVGHRTIWSCIVELAARHEPVDVITVFERLREQQHAEACGGLAYLNELAQSVAGTANLRRYVEIVQDKALRRAILNAADEVRAIVAEPGSSAADKLDRAASLFVALSTRRQQSAPRPLSELILERTAHWEALADGTAPAGAPTGLPTLDRALGGGLKPGKLLVLAARPSVGKTSLAQQIALSVAAQGAGVLLLSQEMTAGDLVDRAAANLGRVGLGALSSGQFRDEDWTRITDAMEIAAHLPLFIEDEPALTLLAIRSKVQALQRRQRLGLVVLDYLQLCSGSNPRDNRNQQVEEISRGLKTLAKEAGITVLALSQLNRRAEDRGEPALSDLRDSGAVEQDADTVILLHPKDDADMPEGEKLVVAILAKNRQGRRGRLALAFHGATQRWSESAADVSASAKGRKA